MSSTTSPLLSLPPELRNLIYEYVAHSTEEVGCARGHVISPTLTFSTANKQVHAEFAPIFNKYVQRHVDRIRAQALDLNFDNIQRFLRGLVPLANAAKRAVVVEVGFTKPECQNVDSFYRWYIFSASGDTEHAFAIGYEGTFYGDDYEVREIAKLVKLIHPLSALKYTLFCRSLRFGFPWGVGVNICGRCKKRRA